MFGELWSTNYRDLEVQLYPQNPIFRNTIFRPLGGAAPEIFTRATECPSLASIHQTGDGAPQQFFSKGGQKLVYTSAY